VNWFLELSVRSVFSQARTLGFLWNGNEGEEKRTFGKLINTEGEGEDEVEE
jgi:hypothetical protein